MTYRDSQVNAALSNATAHVHRWRIGEPAGTLSEGVCGCGATKRFVNVFLTDLKGADFKGSQYYRGPK